MPRRKSASLANEKVASKKQKRSQGTRRDVLENLDENASGRDDCDREDPRDNSPPPSSSSPVPVAAPKRVPKRKKRTKSRKVVVDRDKTLVKQFHKMKREMLPWVFTRLAILTLEESGKLDGFITIATSDTDEVKDHYD